MQPTRLAVLTAAIAVALAGTVTFAGCGSSNSAGSSGDGGDDGTTDGTTEGATDGAGADATKDGGGSDAKADGPGAGDGGHKDGGPSDAALMDDVGTGVFGDGGNCVTLGNGCASSGECCSATCTGNVCAYPACVSQGQACSANSQCCSQVCGASGTCSSLNGGACGTLGNACTMDGQCCSANCVGTTCQPSSWCSQTNDICSKNADCCSGACTIPSGQSVGVCSVPNINGNCSQVDGMLCTPGTVGDAGTCGGACCSRLCAPWGATGINVCQPATGCHVFNDTCTVDSECCGSAALIEAGAPGPQNGGVATCAGGYCTYPGSCAPNGDVCKLMTMSCTAHQDCCAGNGNKNTACRPDNVGVPRCASGCDPDAGLGGSGSACSTSADCCNGDPCVPNPSGNPPYICANTTCVPSCATCSTTADCCSGYSCVNGICDPCGSNAPDGGTGPGPDSGILTCSQFGQLCDPDAGAPCCVSLRCSAGRCID